ncbi:MAG: cell division FtsA domain-containing protein [Patescibacteria group bacterium]|nr:pilus assembly protein PilM [Patescibacteria group bacterium]
MKLPLFTKKEHKIDFENETLLALDVGTSFVKACVFQVKNNKVHILGYGRAAQQSDAMKGAMIVNLQNVIENCDLALGEAVKGLQTELPRKVIVGIAGELVKGVTIMAKYDRETPDVKITKKEIEEVVEKVRGQAFQNVKTEIAEETGLLEEQIEEISSVINDTFIDGFRVTNPLEFQGKNINFRVFSTFAPSIHLNSLKSIAQALGLEILDIIVEPYAITRAYEGAVKDDFSAVFIDIGGGTTDIALVQKGGIMGTKMMAFGGKVFTKRLETEFGLSYRDAENLKLEYSERELSDKKRDDIRTLFSADSNVWADGVELALREFEDVKVYPQKFLLCGGGTLLSDIKTSLMEHPWLQVLRFERFPEVEFISPDNLKAIVDPEGFLKDVSDIAPAALAYMALELK